MQDSIQTVSTRCFAIYKLGLKSLRQAESLQTALSTPGFDNILDTSATPLLHQRHPPNLQRLTHLYPVEVDARTDLAAGRVVACPHRAVITRLHRFLY